MYMSTVTECDNFEEKTLFLLYFGDRVIAPVKCCLTYIYPFIAEENLMKNGLLRILNDLDSAG